MHPALILSYASAAFVLPAIPIANATPLPRTSFGGRRARQAVASPSRFGVSLLTRASTTSNLTSSSYLRSLRAVNNTVDLLQAQLDQVFITQLGVGNQQFNVVLDTGSSDTWVVESDFQCVNYTGYNEPLPQSACQFGPPFTPDQSFAVIRDENFNITYGSGEFLNGVLGYDSVRLAGITVPKQEVALASLAGWSGDGISSGLVGLAFPSLTDAYPGTNASLDVEATPLHPNVSNRITYSSIINTIFFVDNLTDPLFSLALSRDVSNTSFGGIFSIGGIPATNNPLINASSTFTSTDIQYMKQQFLDPNTPEYQFYTITIDGLVYNDTEGSATQYIVDSGTTMNYVPTADAVAFNSLFHPPAWEDSGIWFVDCNATSVPDFGVSIGGCVFPTNRHDLVVSEGEGTCISGIQDGGLGPYILGDVFLKNVLAVYDVGRLKMRFSARPEYQS